MNTAKQIVKLYKKIYQIKKEEHLLFPFTVNDKVDIKLERLYKHIDSEYERIEYEAWEDWGYDMDSFLVSFDYKWIDVVDDEEYQLLRDYYNIQILIEQIAPKLEMIAFIKGNI